MLARARSLFDEGLAFVDAQEWDQAVLRFEEVLRIRSSSVVIYNLASALVHLGRLVEAVELLRPIVGDTTDVGPAAKQLLASIQPRIASLTLRITGVAPGDAVFVGTRQVPLEHLGRPINVDPGLGEVRVERDAAVLVQRQVEVLEGDALELALSLPTQNAPTPAEVAAEAEAGAEGAPDSDAMTRADRPLTKRPWFWIASAGVVVAATVIAIVVAGSGGAAQAEPVRGDAGLISGEVMPP